MTANGNAITGPRAPQARPDDPNKLSGSSVTLGDLYERVARNGRRYLVGRLGVAKVFVVATGERSKGNLVWRMYLGETQYVAAGSAALAREVADAEAPHA
jgi:hypothetical protein